MTPVFCLAQMRPGYSVSDCDQEHRAAFAVAIYERAKMTWLDLTLAPRHGLGIEKIARSSFRVAIPPEITPDVQFISLRFHGTAPMVGYRNGRTFHIVWLDPDFSVYQHS